MSGTYTVKSKDTLSGIALKHGVSLKALLAANPKLNAKSIIHLNDKIKLPLGVSTREVPTASGSAIEEQEKGYLRMTFDGKKLELFTVGTNQSVYIAKAISGLPPKAPHLHELIAKGRKDLKIDTDYTEPKYQDVHDAGPIQEDSYTLPLTQTMAYEKTSADGLGWGAGGWRLKEGFVGRLGNIFGGRSGFFLHHDGGSRGTAGCIGVKHGESLGKIKNLLIDAYKKGQREVEVVVKYDN